MRCRSPRHHIVSFRLLLILLALPLLLSPSAAGYCPRTKILVDTEFSKARFVIVGQVISQRAQNDGDGFLEATYYSVRVETVFRGVRRQQLTIVSENDSGRFLMDTGGRYLLFVRANDGHLVIDNCANSQPMSKAQDVIATIRRIANHGPYGEIHIRVASGEHGVSGIRFAARSGKGVFVAVTADDGWAHLKIPPGVYKLTGTSVAYYLAPYDLNEDDLAHFVVPSGGAVQFDFDAAPK